MKRGRIYRNTIIAYGIILSVVSCTPTEKNSRTASEKIKAEKVQELLDEANSILMSDTAFWSKVMNSNTPHSASADRVIQEKLDSAILLSPHDKRPYIRKINYLTACRKADGLLPLLIQMENKCDSVEGDFLCIKALLEYHNGDSINGQKSFRLADASFKAQLNECSTGDSLRYGSLRLSKALNLSLMKNDFSIFRDEFKLFQKLFPNTGTESMGVLENMKTREEYYQTIFPSK